MKKWMKSVAVVGVTLSAVFFAVGASQGSITDPLVTLSYLTDIFTPEILVKVEETTASSALGYQETLKTTLSELETSILEKMDSNGIGAQATFQVVALTSGQVLTAEVGSEFILRNGTATAVATPNLMDTTTGGLLGGGSPLESNHLYLSMADSQGMMATTDCTVMVRGAYNVA